MLITAGWRRLFRRNCIWVVINDSEVTYGYKKSESSLNLRYLPKEPPFKGSFHLFFVQLLSLLSFSLLYLKQFYILIPISTIPENNYLFTNTLKTKPYQNSNTFE